MMTASVCVCVCVCVTKNGRVVLSIDGFSLDVFEQTAKFALHQVEHLTDSENDNDDDDNKR